MEGQFLNAKTILGNDLHMAFPASFPPNRTEQIAVGMDEDMGRDEYLSFANAANSCWQTQ